MRSSPDCPPEQAKEWDEAEVFPSELWERMADWAGSRCPTPRMGRRRRRGRGAVHPGRGARPVQPRRGHGVHRHVHPGPRHLPTGAATSSDDRFRDGLLEGRDRFAVAISEPDAGSDAAALRTAAEQSGDHFVVNGQKMWCTGAGLPGTMIAMYVRTDPGAPKHAGHQPACWSTRRADGVEIRRTPTLARHILGTNEVYLHDVVVPKGQPGRPRPATGGTMLLCGLELEKVLMSGALRRRGPGDPRRDAGLLQAAPAVRPSRSASSRPSPTRWPTCRPRSTPPACSPTGPPGCSTPGRACSREGAMAKLKGSETYVAAARLGMQVLAGHGFSTESVMSFRWRESIVATDLGRHQPDPAQRHRRSMGLRTY